MTAFSAADRPLARAVAAASEVLLFRPGFDIDATFRAVDGPRGAALRVRAVHPPSGAAAHTPLDLRMRAWSPLAFFVALVAATRAPAPRRAAVLVGGVIAFIVLTLLFAWVTALAALVGEPKNPLGMHRFWRTAFNVMYTVLLLSNPTPYLIAVLLWAVPLRASLFSGFSIGAEAVSAANGRRTATPTTRPPAVDRR